MKYFKAAILAVIFVMMCFFWVAHPVLKDYAYVLRNFITAAVIAAVYLGFGVKIQKMLNIGMPAIKYPLAFAVSTGAVGTLFFLAGFAGLYNVVFACAVLAVLAAVSYSEIKAMLLDAASLIRGLRDMRLNLEGAAYCAAAGFIFLYWFFLCLTPPVYYDTLVYHMAVPEQYIQAGRIINMKENIFSFYPQLMQMNCLFSLLISDELSVKLMYLFMAIMSMAALAALAGELKADKKIAVILLAACPLFMLNSTRIGAELPLMFFTVLFIYALIKAIDPGLKAGDGIMLGSIAGMIMSIKYTGIVIYFFGGAVFLYLLIKRKAEPGQVIPYLLVPAGLVLPYLLRNYFYTGDPFYPFFTGFFSVDAVLRSDAVLYVSHVNGFGLPHTILNLLRSPFEAVYDEKLFGGDAMSPLLLVSAAALPFTDIKKTGIPALFMLFYFITWFFTGEVLRFLIPLIPVAAVIAAQAYSNSGSKMKYLACGLLVIIQTGFSLYFGENYLRPFQLFTLDRREYINRYVSYYKAADFINTSTEKNAVILMLGEARTYYVNRRALAYTVFNKRRIFEDFDEMPADKLAASLYLKNIKYILVNRGELDRLKGAGYADVDLFLKGEKFKNIMDKYFKKIYSDENCDVYSYAGRQ